jgi:L-cystine transport system permease protein
MSFKFEDFLECLQSGLKYLPNTLLLTIVPVVIGLIFGTIIAIIRIYNVKILSPIFATLVTIYNAIPFVLSMMIINTIYTLNFDKIADFLHLNVSITEANKMWIGYIVLSLMNVAYMSEAMRGAFLSIDKFQFEAGYSVGLTNFQTLIRIIIPQVIPIAIPILISNVTAVMKTSAIAFSLGIFEVYNGSIYPCNITYSFLEGYVAAAVIYWVMAIIIENLGRLVEKSSAKYRKFA